MTSRSSIFAYLVPAKEEALSKDIHEAHKAQHFDLEKKAKTPCKP
jgi:hypothetical protein